MPPKTHRALIVDDDDVSRYLAVNALGLLGFDCDQAEDGCVAMDMVLKSQYDVVITDLRMPIQNGHGLAVEILKLDRPPLVVVLTSVTEPRIVRDLMVRGVDDVAFKPVPFPAFAAKIKSSLQKAEAQRDDTVQLTGSSQPSKTLSTDRCSSQTQVPSETCSTGAAHGKHIALILLKDVNRARELADSLSSETVHTIVVRTNDELYRRVNMQGVDFLMVEEREGGLLCAAEILERMRSELLNPEVLVVAEPGDKALDRAAALGFVRTISPNASFEEMADQAKQTIAAISQCSEPIPRAARRLVQRCDRLAPMPQLLVKLTEYMRMDALDLPAKQLAAHIATDSQATAELLRRVNSASTGIRRRIDSVDEALHYLGAKRTISLILSSAAGLGVTDLLNQWGNPFREWYQQRSVLIANTAAVFAKRFEGVSEHAAFVLGLLQEIGILVLANSSREKYFEKTLQRACELPQFSLAAAEFADFQITHADVSAALLRKWELPHSMIGPVLHHHSANEQSSRPKTEQNFIRVMRIGEAFANLSDNPHPYRMRKLNVLLAHYGTNKEELYRECLSEATDRTTESCELFSIPVPGSDLQRQTFEKIMNSQQAQWQDSDAEDAVSPVAVAASMGK